jgi:ferrous iron transport protein A
MFLTELACGRKARIVNFIHVNYQVEKRLMDLNIIEGTEFVIKRTLSLGGPIIIDTNGQCVGIRRKDAKKILVEYI